MSTIKTYRVGEREVTAMRVDTVDDILELRAAEEWHEGAVALLSYPSAEPQAFVSIDNPKYFGRLLALGNVVVKGPAGDFAVFDGAAFAAEFEEVAA